MQTEKATLKRGPGRPKTAERKDRKSKTYVVNGLAAGEARTVSLSGGNISFLQRLADTNGATISDAVVAILMPVLGRKLKGAEVGGMMELTLPPAVWVWVEAVGGIDSALKIAGVE